MTNPLQGGKLYFNLAKAAICFFPLIIVGIFVYIVVISALGRVGTGAASVFNYILLLGLGFTAFLFSTFKDNLKLNVKRRTKAEVALAEYAHFSGASDDLGIIHNCFYGTLWSSGYALVSYAIGFLSVINTSYVNFSIIFINVVIAFVWSTVCQAIGRRWLKPQEVDKNGNPNGVGILDDPKSFYNFFRNMENFNDRQRFNDFLDRHFGLGDSNDRRSDNKDFDDDDDDSPPRRY